MNEDRRRFHRIHFDAPARLNLDHRQIEVSVVDCSLKGVMIKRPADWNPAIGDPVELQLRLAADDEVGIRMQTKVKRLGEESIGLACDHIDLESITRLRRLVELNLGESLLLERDLEHLVDG